MTWSHQNKMFGSHFSLKNCDLTERVNVTIKKYYYNLFKPQRKEFLSGCKNYPSREKDNSCRDICP